MHNHLLEILSYDGSYGLSIYYAIFMPTLQELKYAHNVMNRNKISIA